ncbi:MAG: hypothetical protein COA49_09035 [Bacteroidetes bacterium]|nr:MAG: hypothetical protein COA49_09035 [Bacteroidota bacterium]
MAKLQLDMEMECDFRLLGIGSHVGSHRLAWELNRIFGWDLKFDRVITSYNKNNDTKHIVLTFIDREEGLDVALILNRVPGGVLASGASSLDYLLKLGIDFLDNHDVISEIRRSNLVTMVTKIDPERSGALGELYDLDIIKIDNKENE